MLEAVRNVVARHLQRLQAAKQKFEQDAEMLKKAEKGQNSATKLYNFLAASYVWVSYLFFFLWKEIYFSEFFTSLKICKWEL